MSAGVAARGRAGRPRVGAAVAALAAVRWLPEATVLAVAAWLRLAGLGRMADDPFYDAAVRSMGRSGHAFLTGAIDPGAHVSVDKPPLDLWLQVAATRLGGFSTWTLHLPEALGSLLAVGGVYALGRTLAGRGAGLIGAAALAVLPAAVVTGRSDTMDGVMAALVVAAAALVAWAVRSGRAWPVVAAGGVLGLAFEVKLAEALLAAPALAVLWLAGSRLQRSTRRSALGGAAVALVVVGLAWLVVLSVAVPRAQRPWAYGSSTGSAWQSTFVYDGLDRLGGGPTARQPAAPAPLGVPSSRLVAARQVRREQVLRDHLAAVAHAPAPPGPLRLLEARGQVRRRLGLELAAALVATALALLTGGARRLDRTGRAGLAALLTWVATGTVVLSTTHRLQLRYAEAVTPAIAALLGVAAWTALRALVGRGAEGGSHGALGGDVAAQGDGSRPAGPAAWWRPAAGAAVAIALLAVLGAGLGTAGQAVAHRSENAGRPGALPLSRTAPLVAYLAAHRGGARYSAASASVGKAASLLVAGADVLPLEANDGHEVVGPDALARAVRSGAVRYALLGAACSEASADRATGCSTDAIWIRAHGVDRSLAAGQPHAGLLYALSPRVERPTGSARRAASTRRAATARTAARPLRASRAGRLGRGRGRPRSHRRSPSSAAPARRAQRSRGGGRPSGSGPAAATGR